MNNLYQSIDFLIDLPSNFEKYEILSQVPHDLYNILINESIYNWKHIIHNYFNNNNNNINNIINNNQSNIKSNIDVNNNDNDILIDNTLKKLYSHKLYTAFKNNNNNILSNDNDSVIESIYTQITDKKRKNKSKRKEIKVEESDNICNDFENDDISIFSNSTKQSDDSSYNSYNSDENQLDDTNEQLIDESDEELGNEENEENELFDEELDIELEKDNKDDIMSEFSD